MTFISVLKLSAAGTRPDDSAVEYGKMRLNKILFVV